MTASILISIPGHPNRELKLERNSYRIGRDPESDIHLESSVVSRKHGLLELRGLEWVYSDLGSRNGTILEDQPVQQVTLRDGMRLRIGRDARHQVVLTFLAEASAPKREPAQVPGGVGMETVVSEKEPTTGLIHLRSVKPQEQRPLILGRSSSADVSLASPSVSRRHAMLQPSQPEWQLLDLGSKNGTFLNGKRLKQPELLRRGDIIQIGPFRMVYEGQGQVNLSVAGRGLRLDGLNLTLNVGSKRKPKNILQDVSISCLPQEFIGLVGGSGAGKSTLMKALCGLYSKTEGRILVEGEDLYNNYDAYRTMIGYMPQDDILHGDLTVEQALNYSARLRLPPDTAEAEFEARVRKVMEQVELTGQSKTLISKLSGGQRKRASIAVELLADPPLFFLDEPTSGLDPGLERKLMLTLRKLADSGKTIILVTHATANITECDQVAFMSNSRLVYYGPPREAGDFFEVGSENFADIYNQISDPEPKKSVEKARAWEERFRSSPLFKKFITERFKTIPQANERARPSRPSGQKFSLIGSIYQFLILVSRYFNLVRRDRTLMIILLLVMPLLALLILGLAEPNWLTGDTPAAISQNLDLDLLTSGKKDASYMIVGSSQKLLFIMALTAVMLGLFSSAYEIAKERSIYQRERMVSLQLAPYLASKIFLLGAFGAVQSLLFLLVIRWQVTLPERGVLFSAFWEMYITLFLGVLAAIALGMFISAIAPTQNTVTYIIMGILFLQITFAGVIFDLPGSAKLLSGVTLTRWAMEGLGASANLAELDTLSRTRFKPDPVTEEASVEIEKPAPDWKPVTVTTEMKQIPGCVDPVPMTNVVENEMVKVKETVSKTVTVDPDPVDILTPYGFTIDYEHSADHLLRTWAMLVGLSAAFITSTLITLKLQDIV
ncbi:MAG: FHA domain-containing protein [Chloroflexi bacterium]|nr:FHA domain-containing protein [Chloroflexota bacterium]